MITFPKRIKTKEVRFDEVYTSELFLDDSGNLCKVGIWDDEHLGVLIEGPHQNHIVRYKPEDIVKTFGRGISMKITLHK